MALYSLNLCTAYTRSIKKSVGWDVKAGVQMSRDARDDKGEKDAQYREGQGESAALVAVRLR